MLSFAGGVRDTNGRRAFIPVAPETVVAIDIAAGTVLWRRIRIGRPMAATLSRLVTLEAEGKSFVLRLVDAATGRDAGRAEHFGMPDWAAQIGTAPDAVEIETSETPNGIRLEWRLRRPYHGGASPTPQIATQISDESTGAILLEPDTGQIRPADAMPTAEIRNVDVAPDLGPHAIPEPDVLAFERVGDRLFALKVQAEGSLVSLEAHNAHDGALLWDVPLSQGEANRPLPQRK